LCFLEDYCLPPMVLDFVGGTFLSGGFYTPGTPPPPRGRSHQIFGPALIFSFSRVDRIDYGVQEPRWYFLSYVSFFPHVPTTNLGVSPLVFGPLNYSHVPTTLFPFRRTRESCGFFPVLSLTNFFDALGRALRRRPKA